MMAITHQAPEPGEHLGQCVRVLQAENGDAAVSSWHTTATTLVLLKFDGHSLPSNTPHAPLHTQLFKPSVAAHDKEPHLAQSHCVTQFSLVQFESVSLYTTVEN
jgi:hypothetical protein